MTHAELDRYVHEELNINWFPHTPGAPQGYLAMSPAMRRVTSLQMQQTLAEVDVTVELPEWHRDSFRWNQPNPQLLIFPNPETAAPEHVHAYYEMMYVYEGAVTHTIGGRRVTVTAGSAVIVPPQVHHRLEASPGAVAFNVILTVELVSALLQKSLRQLPTLSACFGDPASCPEGLLLCSDPEGRAAFYFRELLCQTYDPDSYSGRAIEMLLPLLLMELERSGGVAAPSHSPRGIDDDLDRVLQYIDANYASATLSEAASRFGYTSGYISKALKRATGQSFSQLRQSRCVLRAASLLAEQPSRSVTSIAEEVGIGNITQFYRLFDQQFHMTPKAYRRQRGER